ncbi:MAG: hypothetical protein ACHQ52_09075, partial [Candidatus Eisenbacteria bacterium]
DGAGGAGMGRGGAGAPGAGGGAWAGRGGTGGTPGAGAGQGAHGHAGGGAWAGRGGAGARDGAASDPANGSMPNLDRAMAESANEAVGALKPGRVYVLRDGKPTAIMVMTGLTDGVATEIRGGDLKPGDQVITALEPTTRGPQLQPPPGMGGPMGGPRPGGGRGR